MKTRRQFIRSSLMGAAATWTLPTFLNSTIFQLDSLAANSATQAITGKDGRILVVLQMGGGNDGLNTIVPYAVDDYYKARNNIAIAESTVIKLNDQIGMNPNLKELKNLYDSGHAALINGVGYPNPNRSHFRSMDIWQTASDSDDYETTGWIGRYFDNACTGCPATVGVDIGSAPPLAFAGGSNLGIAMANAESYRYIDGASESSPPMMRGENGDNSDAFSGSSIENPGASASVIQAEGSNLDFLQRTALDAEMSSQDVQDIVKRYKSGVTYPSTRLASDLRLIAKLISGGLPTRIYYANQGGYDTHANQLGTHERLMTELSQALGAFIADLKEQGNLDRVLVMTFSEFGRRLKENGSGGTDHGVAGPMFLLGGGLKAGMYGSYPSLRERDLDKGDLKHTVDFRSVYATVLENWLQTESGPILKKSFPKLDFI